MKKPLHNTTITLLTTTENAPPHTQSKKKSLSLEDLSLWRKHTVTLSDNGEWYTKQYSLYRESKSTKNILKAQRFAKYYPEDNQTYVLYICHSKDGIKYQVPDGAKPIFSASSDWVAYQIKPASERKEAEEKKDEQNYIELLHLPSGFKVSYQSKAKYHFLEEKNYFITADNNSLLIYDLDNRKEHYIGNIGEYLVDKQSKYIAYTIDSEDKRGNGIYLYALNKRTTKALQTGNFKYSNLSWNHNKNELAAYKYQIVEKEVDYTNINIIVINGIDAETSQATEYPVKDIEGFAENMGIAVKTEKSPNTISWSKDGNRLFLKVKEYVPKEEKKAENSEEDSYKSDEKPSVQVWHWKDQKLLSYRIMEHEKNKTKVFDAIFFRKSNTLIQLTGEEIQKLILSKGTDNWAIGTDNRAYISDWDVSRNDLYRINLQTGEKRLIKKNLGGSSSRPPYKLSPDGKRFIFWDGQHYWFYDLENDSKKNISAPLNVSFVNNEHDEFGYIPDYGFVGWVKDKNAIIVNHKYDIWFLPLDNHSKAKNLTASVTSKDTIRFRFEDLSFKDKQEITERYIDLSAQHFLYAYNLQTKYTGFYKLQEGELTAIIYQPASFHAPWRGYKILKSKNSNTIIYTMEDYENYPEAYLSTLDFSKPQKITHTNPQQENFKWGKRILIHYTNNDGVPLQGILSIPEAYKKGQQLPMIVFSYEKLSQRMYTYPTPYLSGANISEMLYVSEGYLFLQPDIHFNVGSPHSDMHQCIDAAIQQVIELGYVDEQKIGYEGFSYGGHAGMYISTQNNKFAAIAAGAGVSNLIQGFNIDIVKNGNNEQGYYINGQGRLGTDPMSDMERYLSESPVFNAQTMNTPLLLFHGTADNVVQWEHSFGLYSILRYLKKPVIFLSYLGEGHGLNKAANRLDLQTRLKEFFDHHLKGQEKKKWMQEDQPYLPEEASNESNEKTKSKRELPKWK